MTHWLRLHSPIQYISAITQIEVATVDSGLDDGRWHHSLGRMLGMMGVGSLFPRHQGINRPYTTHDMHDSPKAAMLSPYRCLGGISLVSGLRSECLSSSIGSSRALCSWHIAAYQQHACAHCCPDDCP
jgi:hypothetical protein